FRGRALVIPHSGASHLRSEFRGQSYWASIRPSFTGCRLEARAVVPGASELVEVALVEARVRRADEPPAIDEPEDHAGEHEVHRQEDRREQPRIRMDADRVEDQRP